MLGYVPYDKVLTLRLDSLALLFPSIWEELLPYVIVKSMLAGTLPIASRVGGVPEIVEGTYAEKLLCTPNNAFELAERIEHVLSMDRGQIIDVSLSLREAALDKFDIGFIKKELVKALFGLGL